MTPTQEKAYIANIQQYLENTCGKCPTCDKYNCKLYGVRKVLARDDLVEPLDASTYFGENPDIEQQIGFF